MGVTARGIREYYDAFSEFDKDRNGSINTSELGNVFRSLGENPTSMELEVRPEWMARQLSVNKIAQICCKIIYPLFLDFNAFLALYYRAEQCKILNLDMYLRISDL